jgi:formyltetrahydrofolate deformylase
VAADAAALVNEEAKSHGRTLPDRQADRRGSSATAHYVTNELDKGPIIEQDVVRVSHRDTLPDFVRKGRELERAVLTRAVRLHLERRVLVSGDRTVVFS